MMMVISIFLFKSTQKKKNNKNDLSNFNINKISFSLVLLIRVWTILGPDGMINISITVKGYFSKMLLINY